MIFFKSLHRLFGCNRGSAMTTFALAIIPTVGIVGSAVDYSRAIDTKTAMQTALDATGLMLAKKANTLSPAEMSSAANVYFQSLFNRPDATNVIVKADVGGSEVVLTGSASVGTYFMGIMGFNSIPINASSTTKWGTNKLRVALALDNTGSMGADGKMTALKTAAKNFINQMKASAVNNGDIYVSIVPFAKDVNVGKGYSNADWVDWTAWDNNRDRASWNGCVTDRGGPTGPDSNNYDQTVTLPVGTAASKWPAEYYTACPVAMMGLTYDWTALTNLVDSMTPNGTTNQAIGLVWAWQTLVGGGPITVPPKTAGSTYTDVIILMSDGLNTQNRWYVAYGNNVAYAVDDRMYNKSNGTGTCANAKASGVVIYAIQVNTSNDPVSTLMKNCASSPDKFSQITSAGQLLATFNSIATSLTQLRIAN